ncbi:MAG: hypothetical protein ACI9DJ_000818 [Algoriphagus sp.]
MAFIYFKYANVLTNKFLSNLRDLAFTTEARLKLRDFF